MPPPERRPSDTPRAYAALCDYYALGDGRSLEKLVQMWSRSGLEKAPTRWLSTLKRWSSAGDWQSRVQSADQRAREAEDAARQAIRAARRLELENKDWETGNALREAARAILAELPKFIRGNTQRIERDGVVTEIITVALRAGPGEIARALEQASKLQRLSVGEATEIHKLVESELRAFLDLLEHNLSAEEFARIVALAAGERTSGA